LKTYPWWEEWIRVCDRCWDTGYESLTDDEKLWLTIRQLIDSVNNGGVVSYFDNSGADKYEDCLASLHALGAVEIASHVKRFAALFGTHVPASLELRNEIISSWRSDGYEIIVSEDIEDAVRPLVRPLERSLESFLVDRGYCKWS
jgi:hypothetical protein